MHEVVECPNCLHYTLQWVDATESSVVCTTCKMQTKTEASSLADALALLKGATPVQHLESTLNRKQRRTLAAKKPKKPVGRPRKNDTK